MSSSYDPQFSCVHVGFIHLAPGLSIIKINVHHQANGIDGQNYKHETLSAVKTTELLFFVSPR